jgi:hypothetical protein
VAGLPQDPATIEFGRFKVVRHRRELLADGRPVELGGRAFDTLLALIDARGTVLGKDELISRVWPDRVVEETTCRRKSPCFENSLAPIVISFGRWPGVVISSRARSGQPPPRPLVLLPRG